MSDDNQTLEQPYSPQDSGQNSSTPAPESPQPIGRDPAEVNLMRNQGVANSDDAKLEKMMKDQGWTDAAPVPGQTANGAKPGNPGDAFNIPFLDNPKQALAGAADAASIPINAGIEFGQAFKRWWDGSGFNWADLQADQKVNLGSYVAPDPVSDDEKRARSTGRFLGELAGLVGGAAVAGAAAPVVGASAGVAAIGGAGAAGFLGIDPNQKGLADYLKNDVGIRNAFLDFWAQSPDDSAGMKRVKNGLSFMLGEGLAQATFKAFSFYKARDLTPEAAKVFQKAVSEPIAEAVAPPATPLASEEKIAAAEGTTTPPPGSETKSAPAPEIPVKGKGQPLASKIKETLANPNYERTTAENYASYVSTRNAEKFSDPEYVKMISDRLGPMAGDLGVKETSHLDVVKGFVKRMSDPDYVENMLRFTPGPGSSVAPHQVADSSLMSEVIYHHANELEDALKARQAAGTATQADILKAGAEISKLDDSSALWRGISEGQGSTFGQGLNFVQIGTKSESAAAQSFRNANPDWYESAVMKMKTGEDGSVEGFLDLRSKARAAAEKSAKESKVSLDPYVAGEVKSYEYKADHPIMGRVAAATDTMMHMAVEGFLSSAKVIVNNPLSHAIQNVYGLMTKTVGAYGAEILEKAGVIAPKEFMTTEENIAKAWGISEKEVKDLSPEQISAFRNVQNLKISDKDILSRMTGDGLAGLVHDGLSDFFRLKWLAKDNPFQLNVAPWTPLVRNMTMDEISQIANPLDRLMAVASNYGQGVMQNVKKDAALKFANSQLGEAAAGTPAWNALYKEGLSKTPGVGSVVTKANPFTYIHSMTDASSASMGMAMERRLAAFKYATANSGTEIGAPAWKAMYEENFARPTPWQVNQITDAAKYRNFTAEITPENTPKPLYYAAKFFKTNNAFRAFAPFTTVATNITNQAIENSPLAFLAPSFQSAMAAGGGERSAAIGKVILGSSIATTFAFLKHQGVLTGSLPENPDARKAYMNANPGAQEYSLHLGGDRYIGLKAFGPLEKLMQVTADMHDVLTHAFDPEHQSSAEDHLLWGIAHSVDFLTPQYLLDATGKFHEWLRDPSSDTANQFLASTFANVPYVSGASRNIRDIQDPNKRDTRPSSALGEGLWTATINNLKNQIPGLSKDLPALKNVFGDEVLYSPIPGVGGSNMSPILSVEGGKPLVNGGGPGKRIAEDEIVRLGMATNLFREEAPDGEHYLKIQMPRHAIQSNGNIIPLTAKQYSDYISLSAGDRTPLFERGLISKEQRDKLNREDNLRKNITDLIKTPFYQDAGLADEDRRNLIKKIVSEKRSSAREALLATDPDLRTKDAIGSLNQMKAHTTDAGVRANIDARKAAIRNGGGISP